MQVLGLGDRSGSMSINQLDLVSDCVTIKNDTSEPVSMKGWKLLSATGNQVQESRSKASVIATGHPLTPPAPLAQSFNFPDDLEVAPGAKVTVWSGRHAKEHHNPPTDLYWTRRFVWSSKITAALHVFT